VAVGLGLDDAYFAGLRDDLLAKRDLLCAGLEEAGLPVFRPAGTYFVTTDIRPLGEDDGLAFCRSLPERCGVAAVPNAVFYQDPARGRHLVRFAFCKRPDVLAEAAARLATLS
jgi:N-succinyldiaminopimelate aminotransferase